MLRKRDMLVAEGVKFDADGRVARESIYSFEVAADSTNISPKTTKKRNGRGRSHKTDGRQPKRRKN